MARVQDMQKILAKWENDLLFLLQSFYINLIHAVRRTWKILMLKSLYQKFKL